MKKLISIISLILLTINVIGQNRSINFENATFSELKEKAKKENKLIFIDAYTTWCGPCKWMDANTFKNDTVADYYNSKFINAKIDMEKGEGIDLAKQYQVKCYPNYLYIDSNGKLIHRAASTSKPKDFIEIGNTAMNPEKQFSHYSDNYEVKKTDSKFLTDFMQIISKTCMPYDHVIADYFDTQNEKDLTNQNNWNIIRDHTKSHKGKEFKYLVSNINEFKKIYSSDSVDNKIKNVLLSNGYNVLYKKNMQESDYVEYKKEISVIKYEYIEKVLFELDLAFLEVTKSWDKYIALALEKGDKYFSTPNDVNNVAWNFYENSNDKTVLEKAEMWMKTTVENSKKDIDWYVLDTYAFLLYKLDKKENSKTIALKAIDSAKKAGLPKERYKEVQELLDKLN